METKNKNKKIVKVIVKIITLLFVVLISAGVGAGSLLIIFKTNPDLYIQKVTNINKSEKEVTVTDEGIADAVDKIYNATTIVEVGTNSENIQGWGSGFIYKTDDKYGYLLTNHHVVENMNYIKVVFSDKREVEGTLIGSDQYADVAVLKVPIDYVIDVAKIGSSDKLRVGDTVFAIGSPVSLNYRYTVTRGILSGKDRMVAATSGTKYTSSYDAWYMNLLQIDASINGGNSGGPLSNCNGEVVGINNSKLLYNSSGTTVENIGFAIPIEVALNIAEQLINDGKVTRPLLGVNLTTISAAAQNDIELSDDIEYGAVILDVQDGTVAKKAGLKKGDVIIKADDFEVLDYMYLKYYLFRHKVGDTITFTYIRGNSEHTVDIKLSD